MSKKTPDRTPGVGDTVMFVHDGGNESKASVLDATLQDLPKEQGKRGGKGIKIMVVPADNSPFPAIASYDEDNAAGTWHWPES